MQSYSNSNYSSATRGAVLLGVLGILCALASLLLYPWAFGIAGVVLGILATKGGSRIGIPVIIISIVLMGIGLIYSGVILNYTTHYLGI